MKFRLFQNIFSLNTSFDSFQIYIDNKIMQLKHKYDGWFLVFIAVLIALAFILISAMSIWCLVYRGSSFTGRFYWENGFQIALECR